MQSLHGMDFGVGLLAEWSRDVPISGTILSAAGIEAGRLWESWREDFPGGSHFPHRGEVDRFITEFELRG